MSRTHYQEPGDRATACNRPALADTSRTEDWAAVDCAHCLRSREKAGRAVRDRWVEQARRHPGAKPSWLRKWTDLDPANPEDAYQREVDMVIGWEIYQQGRRAERERARDVLALAAEVNPQYAAVFEHVAKLINGAGRPVASAATKCRPAALR
jgi:hypothetical protein